MSQLIGKDPDAGKDWGQGEKGATEDEMVGWHHQFNGHEFEKILGDGEGQASLCVAVQRIAKGWTQFSDWTTTRWKKHSHWDAALINSLATLVTGSSGAIHSVLARSGDPGVGEQLPQDIPAASRTHTGQRVKCRPVFWPNWRKTRKPHYLKTSFPESVCQSTKRNQFFLAGTSLEVPLDSG